MDLKGRIFNRRAAVYTTKLGARCSLLVARYSLPVAGSAVEAKSIEAMQACKLRLIEADYGQMTNG